MKNIEHIGIAVSDIAIAEATYTQLLGIAPYKKELVESEGVITLFYKIGSVKIELLAATNKNSVIAKFIEKRGEGIHHIAFGVENANQSLIELEKNGFNLINSIAKAGADEKEIGFVHPKSCHGVLVEVCSEHA